ncbi:RNA polymerase sigma factor [Roseicyclus persicicus]|uniref:Sigma-70 family RNA polymerase sigma factor n=1 Tax=Roseicyclus persicicus TaxID=2650661 RepID=A0A7X6H0J3_9RHOB|nr:sigma-70 family RNA polymerase sigma factor [Roseibacterium persicicum]NKX45801.1 sigma-70 family RNA polymerase sigma factor [Roseibacterium persicicum]
MPDPRPPAPPTASPAAFVALLPDLRRAARRLARSAEDADDLVQDTLLRVWARLAMARRGQDDAAPVADLRAYAFATLRNRARTRPAGLTPHPAGEGAACADPRADPAARIAATEALRALDALPQSQRRLMRLRAIEGLSYAEIAAETGLALGTVTSRLSRGRRALRAALDLPRDAPLADLFAPPPGGG